MPIDRGRARSCGSSTTSSPATAPPSTSATACSACSTASPSGPRGRTSSSSCRCRAARRTSTASARSSATRCSQKYYRGSIPEVDEYLPPCKRTRSSSTNTSRRSAPSSSSGPTTCSPTASATGRGTTASCGRRPSRPTMAGALVGSEILKIAAEIRHDGRAGPQDLQPDGRRLRPEAVPIPPGCSRRCAGARAARPTTRRPTACSSCARRCSATTSASWACATRSTRSWSPAVRGRSSTARTARSSIRATRSSTRCRVEQQPLRAHVRGARRRRCCAGRDAVPADRRRAAERAADGAPPVPQLAAQPDRHGDRRADALRGICEAIVAENRAARRSGRAAAVPDVRPHLLDAVLRRHAPRRPRRAWCPEMAPYTIFIDGISKAFAATGLRVGWAVGPGRCHPPDVGGARPRRRLGAAARAGRDRRPARRSRGEDGWMRLSIGAVSVQQCRDAVQRVGAALRSLPA
jgi:hypothetical protein